MVKEEFESQLKVFVEGLEEYISTEDGQWTVKGFIDVFQNIYTISSDTKIVSKILEIHLFPKIMEFARKYGADFSRQCDTLNFNGQWAKLTVD